MYQIEKMHKTGYAIRVLAIIFLACSFGLCFYGPVMAENVQAGIYDKKIYVVDGRQADEVWINTEQGRFKFTAEIADDLNERSQGLMFRKTMPPTHGMLFDFGKNENVQMWMRNTPLSLDMIFVKPDGLVHHVVERTTPQSETIISSNGPVSHVLELNAGVASLIGIRKGSRLEHDSFKK